MLKLPKQSYLLYDKIPQIPTIRRSYSHQNRQDRLGHHYVLSIWSSYAVMRVRWARGSGPKVRIRMECISGCNLRVGRVRRANSRSIFTSV